MTSKDFDIDEYFEKRQIRFGEDFHDWFDEE